MKGEWRFIRANVRQTLHRFRSLLVALGLGMVILLSSVALVGQALSVSAGRLDEGSELSTLELLSISPAGEPKRLTLESVRHIESMPGVDRVVGAASVGVSLEPAAEDDVPDLGEALAGAFWLMPRFSWSQPPVVSSASDAGEGGDLLVGQILLPSTSFGADMAPAVGHVLTVEYTRRISAGQGVPEQMMLTVVGLYDASSPRMEGEGAAYVSHQDFDRVYGALLGAAEGNLPHDTVYPQAWVKATSVSEANALARTLTAEGYYVKSGGGVASLAPALQMLRQVNGLGAVLLCLFGVGIGLSLSATWSDLRRWDVGLLASLGWSPHRTLRVYSTELALVGLTVGILSAAIGTGVAALGSLALRGRSIMGVDFGMAASLPPWPWLVTMIVGTPVAFLCGGLPRTWMLTRTLPDEALRRPD